MTQDQIDQLRRVLPEIIEWLDVQELILLAERRTIDAEFAHKIVLLFKSILKT